MSPARNFLLIESKWAQLYRNTYGKNSILAANLQSQLLREFGINRLAQIPDDRLTEFRYRVDGIMREVGLNP